MPHGRILLLSALLVIVFVLIISVAILNTAAAEAVFEGLDPLQWASEPQAKYSHTISMSAEAVALPGKVEYDFICTAGGAADSGWQASPTYNATGLKPETVYTFIAKVRDTTTHIELRAPALPITVTTRKANQFDQSLANDIELVPLLVSGNKNNRLNLIVVNRWTKEAANSYNKPGMREAFLQLAREAALRPLIAGDEKALAPLPNLRNFFNIYIVWWPNIPACANYNARGVWDNYEELRERLFLPWQREGKGWATYFAMDNGNYYGNGASVSHAKRLGSIGMEGNDSKTFWHEFGHTALCLGDDYVSAGLIYRPASEGFQREWIPFKAWIDPQTPVPTPYNRKYLNTIGLFEGGCVRFTSVFRPTPVCIMGCNQFASQFCAICKQTAYSSIYNWVSPFDAAFPARAALTLKQPGRAQFSITRIKPEPDTQKVEWRLNGKVIARDVDTVKVELGALAEYELVCSLVDKTEFIREDAPYARYPRAEKRWKIVNPKARSQAEALKVVLQGSNTTCCGANDGAITAGVSGGKPPYTYLWSTGSLEPRLRDLDAGKYSLQVWDSEFRPAAAECTLERPLSVTADARSQLEKGRWQIVLDIRGDDPKNVICKWSTGASGLVLNGLADGSYKYTITHKKGGSITGEVTLAKPARPLQVSAAEVIPSTGENNGQIRLAVTGGREPYTAKWADAAKETGLARAFLPPGEYEVVVKDANLAAVETTVIIKDEPSFAFARPAFEKSSTGGAAIANPQEGYRYLWYAEDYPSYIPTPPRGTYEGTFTTKEGRVVEARGEITANTNGKWAVVKDINPENDDPFNDYGSWARLKAYIDGRQNSPKTIRLFTSDTGEYGQKLEVFDESERDKLPYPTPGYWHLENNWKGTVERGRMVVVGYGPNQGKRFDLLYTARYEKGPDRPLYVGNDFHPSKAGNYFVAAQKEATGAISYNRVGVAITMDPTPQVKKSAAGAFEVMNPKPGYEYEWYDAQSGGVPIATGITFKPKARQACYVAARRTLPFWDKPLKPDAVTGSKPLLWLDAADVDGDGVEDAKPIERGALLAWQGKPGKMGGFIFYEPNLLNGKAVASWQWIWWQQLQKAVKDYQTIIMVFRDHELSAEGSGPWGGVDAYVWDLKGKKANRVAPEFLNGRAWINGEKVDPYATPAPRDFCIATFELSAKSNRSLRGSNVLWEGALAEFIAYDGKLSENERRGVEEYLRRKWLSEVNLESPRVKP
jgi:hypothetical protein